jgi:RNA-directed DNA polymerase
VRYADDFIVGFQHESDARRFLDEMRERLVVLSQNIYVDSY